MWLNKEKHHEVFDLECGTVCSRDMDTDENRCPTVGGFWNVDMAKNGKNLLVDKISNEEVLAKVEDRQMMSVIPQRQHPWIWHILRHESLLLDIIEGRMKGRPRRRRRRLQIKRVGKRWLCGHEARSWRQVEMEPKESHAKNFLHSRILALERERGTERDVTELSDWHSCWCDFDLLPEHCCIKNLTHICHTRLPLSPNTIIWYRWGGGKQAHSVTDTPCLFSTPLTGVHRRMGIHDCLRLIRLMACTFACFMNQEVISK